MKQIIYMAVVDTWRLAAGFGFRRLGDGEWEDFIRSGQKLATRYRSHGQAVERLCRDLFAAFQEYYRQKGKDNDGEGHITGD